MVYAGCAFGIFARTLVASRVRTCDQRVNVVPRGIRHDSPIMSVPTTSGRTVLSYSAEAEPELESGPPELAFGRSTNVVRACIRHAHEKRKSKNSGEEIFADKELVRHHE